MIKKVTIYIILIVTSIVTITPFLWMVSASFMADGQASVYPPRFIPPEIIYDQYNLLFTRLNVATNFMNSLFLSMIVTLISLFLILWQVMLLLSIDLPAEIKYLNYC